MPFQVGDRVQAGDEEGEVTAIQEPWVSVETASGRILETKHALLEPAEPAAEPAPDDEAKPAKVAQPKKARKVR